MVSGQDQIVPYSHSAQRFKRDRTQDFVCETWVRCLKQSARDLTTIIEGTESEFLLIGANLRDFHTRALSISDISSAITGLLSGDEILRTIDGLKELLQSITTYHELFAATTQTRMEQLDKILKRILSISEPLSDFRDITKTLRTLCTTTKIQSALIGNSARGFTILADDVKQLSTMIDAKAESITKDLKALESLVAQTYEKLHLFELRQREKVHVILTNTGAALASLTEKYHLSRSMAEQVLARTTGLTMSVGDIVTSVQFHDITRQRFEQIRKAVHDSCARNESATNSSLPSADKEYVWSGGVHAEQGTMLIAGLSFTVKEFSTAVNSIVSSLISIWKNINDVLKEIRTITKDSKSEQRTVISEVEYCLTAVTSAIRSLSESAESDRELSGAIRSLSGTTVEISQFIQDIRKIGESLTLISWNSNIKAEEIGKAGASLNVVADFIKKLADDSHAKAFDVSGALEAVTHAINDLSLKVSEDYVIEESDIKRMTATMEEMTDVFKVVNEKIQAFLHEIEAKGGQLSSDIEKVARNIDVHNTVRRIVRGILTQLEGIPFDTSSAPNHDLVTPLFTEGTPLKALSGSDAGKCDETSRENVELF
jgi:methyl-accepting chemotaxis protein